MSIRPHHAASAPPQRLHAAAAPATPQRLDAAAQPARRILVVDDLPHMLDLLRALARRVPGMRVRVDAELSGVRALRLLQRERYDLVVSDQRLTDTDGLTVLAMAHRLRPETRRVLMTGYHDVPACMDRIRAAHVDAYLPKPFPLAEAGGLLSRLLEGDAHALAALRKRARALEADAESEGGPLSLAPLRERRAER